MMVDDGSHVVIGLAVEAWREIAAYLSAALLDRDGRPDVDVAHDERGRRLLVLTKFPSYLSVDQVFGDIEEGVQNETLFGITAIQNLSSDLAGCRMALILSGAAEAALVRAAVIDVLTSSAADGTRVAELLRDAIATALSSRKSETPTRSTRFGISIPAAWAEYAGQVLSDATYGSAQFMQEGSRATIENAIEAFELHRLNPRSEVFSGLGNGGLRWVVEAGGLEEDFSTMLFLYRDDVLVEGFGMGGEKLVDGSVLHAAYGIGELGCHSEVFRAHPSVARVIVTTDSGAEIMGSLSDPNPTYSLRFGVAFLPATEVPVEIRAEIDDFVAERQAHSAVRELSTAETYGDTFYGV